MTPEIYAKKKEELLGILTDILQIANLSATDREFFERKKKKLQEDEFSISLIGEFQGGKSTTFDALCGGREISPRGNNIKTSACKIKVTNISGNNEEHAKITWKTNAELVLTISKVLVSLNPEEIGYNPEEKRLIALLIIWIYPVLHIKTLFARLSTRNGRNCQMTTLIQRIF